MSSDPMDEKRAIGKMSKQRKPSFDYAATKRWSKSPRQLPLASTRTTDIIVLFVIAFLAVMATTSTDASNYFDIQGPNFSHEPPSCIEFTNNAGSIADCIAHDNPPVNVEWLDKDNNPITLISKD
ncbi:Down syndrome cell adhesion molecule-like protein Dscam2 [Bactrocera tryoni]|uniref:Down syndrome cell adhesion molecule-like protein Dscam2 n=1 Tax=Bactrocera tryoni TaxID=59916 RepID=UPI001A95D851|nr:Down syndrome cell adhesion molecule-like protein Dscam2 [Bactrocera tryoni]